MVRLGRGADDGEPTRDRELDEAGTDSAGRPVHDEQPARVQLEQVQQPGGGLDRHRERCRLGHGQRARYRRERLQHRQLGVRRGAVAEDPVTDRDPDHAVTHLVDDAGCLEAEDVGEVERHRVLQHPRADLPVERVDPGRLDRDPDLPRTGVRVGCVADVQDAGVAVLLELDCAHG